MPLCGHDTLKTRKTLSVNGKDYDYFSLEASGLGDISRLPYSLKVLLENLLRYEDGRSVSTDDAKAVVDWQKDRRSDREIAFRPARVLMQDFTGVPAVVDLAAMREAVVALGGDPKTINPLSPVDLVIDHSVMIDHFGAADSMKRNMDLEFERNGERYAFLRWGQKAFNNFRVVPPGVGICHQVNLEYLAKGVWTGREGDRTLAYPDTLVGTDSHTTMVNGLGVLGWGVGGIEAEAAMLGQPISMLIPEVIGFKLTGSLKEGTTATDLVLTVVEMLRKKGVVGKFVEFFGDGLDNLPLADRATIANMVPEYGATCGIFPIDAETLRYLRFTGRDEDSVALVEAYAKAQGMWRQTGSAEPLFTDTLALDMGTVEPSLAGPKRPQDRVALSAAAPAFKQALKTLAPEAPADRSIPVAGTDYTLNDGDVVIAAITSCTNTSNPSVLMAAGLVAKKAVERGLTSKPWVKTSLAPGSQVVSDYLNKAGLQTYLDQLGFNVAGYGCTTCIGNSGPLADGIIDAVDDNGLVVTAVLSGNRNFEGRISPQVKANYLASPPLVVAYAIAGSLKADITTAPLGKDAEGVEVFLRDIWPTAKEVADAISAFISPDMYRARYANVFDGPAEWQAVAVAEGETYAWDSRSTYVQHPPYFQGMDATPKPPQDILAARPLAILGDSVTTDHISPAGSIKATSPAGAYLSEHGVDQKDFNSYGARRGNHEVMMRGTFANIRIRNEMAPGTEGGVTKHQPSDEVMAIYDAAMKYAATATPLVILGGKEYGTGSSRDWAAKGTNLLGVKAVIVESFERIHRSNLVGMGVLPLQFKEGTDRKTLGLDGTETFEIRGVAALKPRQDVSVEVTRADGTRLSFDALCRIDTLDELDYFRNGGILQYVLRNLASA
ncbi:aconitate hydratase AcnA [Rhodospirillum rubrum]|uniref:Aconitate hydratase n=1 Tax=Rhodospirillum rubrum (strain ATCC 11170 / ATH 1.1.1 / DSM 467 / LMG 4362 / NCIMB 8255 / S1) TaxID=269796 RepID=Q2RNJ0_RHORT|nr:aconitate hydratase AcnA [Rhodospirillum rubrum]ABC24305.1 aconitase [Rhodospirillum rubrum ATCC 11170]AEO50056.1 aconitate hydratase [Rhodospirillum rubrum F11]MBK5956024.1 aconitate hydratase [Rhodospirillum rubrum]QXG80232.1 aconitate hydratase AcnA [Rhodospirillum rubrum]HAP99569.1 aconitate hydratase AcnA [Rhodospirillum rubrum]